MFRLVARCPLLVSACLLCGERVDSADDHLTGIAGGSNGDDVRVKSKEVNSMQGQRSCCRPIELSSTSGGRRIQHTHYHRCFHQRITGTVRKEHHPFPQVHQARTLKSSTSFHTFIPAHHVRHRNRQYHNPPPGPLTSSTSLPPSLLST
jgi:hypothetical protein